MAQTPAGFRGAPIQSTGCEKAATVRSGVALPLTCQSTPGSMVSPLLSVAVFLGQLASAKRLSKQPKRPPPGHAPPRPSRSATEMEEGEGEGAVQATHAAVCVRQADCRRGVLC